MKGINKVLVEVNSVCNSNCTYCYIPDKTGTGEDSFDYLAGRIREFRLSGTRYIDFTGGEPTLWPHLPRIVRYAKSLGYENMTLVTNGRRLSYKKYLDRLIQSGIERIIISYDGPTRKIAESITRTPGSFSQTLKAFRNVKESSAELGATIVVVKANIDFARRIPSEIIPRYDDVYPYLREAVKRHEKRKINIHFVPFCCLPGLEKKISPESVKDDRYVVNFSGQEYNLGEHLRKGCLKSRECEGCEFSGKCIGFFSSYASELGIEERVSKAG
jgi:MoaA/NifB/PqqE/SkfB family radical SAM enzyme